MLGNRIIIETKKDYGPGKNTGKSLLIEINGFEGMIIIRENRTNTFIGTRVKIYSRKNINFYDEYIDQVNLIETLQYYAANIEFNISAECKIKGIEKQIEIPPKVIDYPTIIEEINIKGIITHKKNLNEIHPELSGYIKETFIVDNNKTICLSNNEATWEYVTDGIRESKIVLKTQDAVISEERFLKNYGHIISIDGISVMGVIREKFSVIGKIFSKINVGGTGVYDVRGSIKPNLKADRTPDVLSDFHDLTPSWRYINDLLWKAYTGLWDDILNQLSVGKISQNDFWKLFIIYDLDINYFSLYRIINSLALPFFIDNSINWVPFKDLHGFRIERSGNCAGFINENKEHFCTPTELTKWADVESKRIKLIKIFHTVLILCSEIQLKNAGLYFIPLKETKSDKIVCDFIHIRSLDSQLLLADFKGELSPVLFVQSEYFLVNRNHPTVKLIMKTKYKNELSEIEDFITNLLSGISSILKFR